MNMMISYQELVRTFLNILQKTVYEPGHLELLDKVLKLCAKNIQASEFDSLLGKVRISGEILLG
ncbi:hypothetical protein FCX19_26895 [Escherichia coli]|nr:hypothetical protein [Escherichia coli]